MSEVTDSNGKAISSDTISIIDEICACFSELVNRRAGEPIQWELPDDWKEQRPQIEAMWPMRALLLSHVRTRLKELAERRGL